MRAARFYAAGDIRVDTIPDPPAPSSDEVTIEVHWGGICGTDLHEYIQGPVVINPESRPHSLTHAHLPVTMGHEFCGKISAVPDGADQKFRVGQPVMVDPRINCGTCDICRSGLSNMCSYWGFVGLNGGGGGGAGFSEKVNIKTRMLHVLPEDVNLDSAALIEPLAVGRRALSASGLVDFTNLDVLVLGGGPVGLAVLFNLRAQEVDLARVFVSEPTAMRQRTVVELKLAEETNVLNPLIVNVAEECRSKTGQKGIDIVFDCAGVLPGLHSGMHALKVKGTYVNVAGWETPVGLSLILAKPADTFEFDVPLGQAMIKEITLKFTLAYNDDDFREVVSNFAKGKS